MLIITSMLGRGTLYVSSSTIVDVVETIGCFMFFNAEGDGSVRSTDIKFRTVRAGEFVDAVRSPFGV